MKMPKTLTSSSKKIIALISIALVVLIGLVIWQKKKYKIADDTLKSTIASATDSLYSIKYDSLYFDEIKGYATLQNVHIIPDTNRLKKLSVENTPYFIVDIKIQSLVVTGVKTVTALGGRQMVGDSIRIDNPIVTLYNLKPLRKETKIESETKEIYEQILGKLDLIKVKAVVIKNLIVQGIDFDSKMKNFDVFNGNIQMQDVLIDSAHNLDSNRVLFSKQADFSIDSIFTYQNNKKQLSVTKILFLGKEKSFSFHQIEMNRFPDSTSEGIRLLDVKDLQLNGVHTDEIVKNKNWAIDTILCKNIIYYESPLAKNKSAKKNETNDSTGFLNVYSINLQHLLFPQVKLIPYKESNYKIGNVALKINGVQSHRLSDLIDKPINYSKEIEVAVDYFKMSSKNGKYDFNFKKVVLNSLRGQLKIESFAIIPYKNEIQFAANEPFQQDRYSVTLSGIRLDGIKMSDLLDKKIIASQLLVNRTNASIYRDLTKPLQKKNKVGNYPSQLLKKLDMPIYIKNAVLSNANIEYKEKEVKSNKVGKVSFSDSKLTISNITNIPTMIAKNKALNIGFDSKALGVAPITGNFKFFLDNDNGAFVANGFIKTFDAMVLNKISIPMALIEIKSGKINSLDFHFNGNNTQANGEMVMKYKDLKVDVLKIDEETKDISKKGLVSLLANLVVKNDNPQNGELRTASPEFKRDIYKSFFNLVWKTLFTGMKTTLGVP
jgi:hypothetical protein